MLKTLILVLRGRRLLELYLGVRREVGGPVNGECLYPKRRI